MGREDETTNFIDGKTEIRERQAFAQSHIILEWPVVDPDPNVLLSRLGIRLTRVQKPLLRFW